MDMNDIVSLAKAGFSAQQIAVFAQTSKVATVPQAVSPTVATVPQAVSPTVATVPQAVATVPQTTNEIIMAELAKLTGAVQANALLQSQQPKEQTTDEILAEIINPTLTGGVK